MSGERATDPTAVALPRVSVVVRSSNRPSLAEALESIAAQDYPALEVVVVGASGAGHPAPPSAGAHPMIFAASPDRLSRPRAANRGLDAASGDWITFLDDDDVLLPGHVAGLVAARLDAPDCKLVYVAARARFADGGSEPIGQPFALIQLYERNFIHLSMALFARELLTAGCRFDESLDVLQDWDFFIQCAQHTVFHFDPRQTFEWRADMGGAGTGAGRNQDDTRFATFRDRIYAKWAAQHAALADRVERDLGRAGQAARAGEIGAAEAICDAVLRYSPNDPFALNLLASLRRSRGDLPGARATQELACRVRPHDPSLAYNLALVCRMQGDLANARAQCQRAVRAVPEFLPATKLLAELDSAASSPRRAMQAGIAHGET